MLKKTIRRLGALAMVLAMAVSVFAVNASATGEGTTVTDTREFIKNYSTADSTLKEALEYKTTGKSAVNTTESTDAELDITVVKAEDSNKFTISLPQYKGIGQFTYEMEEQKSNTAGVTYDAAKIKVIVTRTWDGKGGINTLVVIQDTAGNKLSKVTNTFKVGTLKVKKELAGSFYNPTDKFTINVTFTYPNGKEVRNTFKYTKNNGQEVTVAASEWTNKTVTVTLNEVQGGDVFNFTNLPEGVTYVVEEVLAENSTKTSNGYTPEYDAKKTGTISTTDTSTTVTNRKDAPTSGGVIMTIAPYALMLVVAGAFAVVFLSRRNRAE